MTTVKYIFSDSRTADAFAEVSNELDKAGENHGSLQSLHEAYAVIKEELDEFWVEVKVNPKKLFSEERVQRRASIRKELRQVAAMAIRAMIDLEGSDV